MNNHLLTDDHKRICAGLQRRAPFNSGIPTLSTAMCLSEGTVIGYDQAEDKRHYHVTPSGLTVVTRDHSLYESPVESDFMNGPRLSANGE